MQLNSKLVDIKIGNNRLFVKYALDFESDGSTEGHASGSTEGKAHFILCVVIGSHMISRSERHREGGLSLATNFLDGQAKTSMGSSLEGCSSARVRVQPA